MYIQYQIISRTNLLTMSSPKVWSRFTAKKRDGTLLKLRIQDLPSDRLEDALNFNMTYFITDENIQRSSGIYKSEEAMSEAREILLDSMKKPSYHISICCLDDDPDTFEEIIGVASITLSDKQSAIIFADKIKTLLESRIKTKEVRKFLEIISEISLMYDIGNGQYYDGRGVSVHPDYRGLGIATEFLKARRMVCKDHGVPMTVAWMSSLGTQKAAEKDGWSTSTEISFDELARRFDVTFDGAPLMCKSMFAVIK